MYILNRSTTYILDDITPFEVWYDKRPDVNHFRVFSFLGYVHIPREHRQKLKPKSEPCIFIGYCEANKEYKLYNPKNHKVVISRDIIFDEGKAWDYKK